MVGSFSPGRDGLRLPSPQREVRGNGENGGKRVRESTVSPP